MATEVINLPFVMTAHVYRVSNFPTSESNKLFKLVIDEGLEPISMGDKPDDDRGDLMNFEITIPKEKVKDIKEKIERIASMKLA